MTKRMRNGSKVMHRLRAEGPELAALSLRKMGKTNMRYLARFCARLPQSAETDVVMALVLCEAARRYLSPKPKF